MHKSAKEKISDIIRSLIIQKDNLGGHGKCRGHSPDSPPPRAQGQPHGPSGQVMEEAAGQSDRSNDHFTDFPYTRL